MKCLTIRQPWASLIAAVVKTIETRSWSTKHRGPIAIHAGKSFHVGPWPPGLVAAVDDLCGMANYPDALPLGAIVATANLRDCVPMVDGNEPMAQHHQEHERWVAVTPNVLTLNRRDGAGVAARSIHDQLPLGEYRPGRYAWLLDDIKPTTERCPGCWGEAFLIGPGPHHVVGPCSTCGGAGRSSGRCDPVPARGRQGLWDWRLS